MAPGRLREIIPLFVLATVAVSGLGLLFEIVGAGVRGVAADPVATPVLGTIFGTTFSALIGLWLKESNPQKPPDPPEPGELPPREEAHPPARPGEFEVGEWNDDGGYFNQWAGEEGRWKLC